MSKNNRIPKCNQCDSMTINGVYCHENGCPNRGKKYNHESESWESLYSCAECGCEYDSAESAGECCQPLDYEEESIMFTSKEKALFNPNTKLKSLLTVSGIHDTNPNNQNRTKTFKSGMLTIQGWLSFSNKKGYIESLDIVPTEKLKAKIAESMLYIEGDQIYFYAIPFPEEGKFKLYAHYNQIIGSRFIGWFKLSEL